MNENVKARPFECARNGDVGALAELLDQDPANLLVREGKYALTLLHVAAQESQADVVELLVARGVDVNARETGDNTYAMHWAAAAGRVDIVKRLADAGGDVIGTGDDHELDVIGWATCWDHCDDDAHRAVVEFLLSRGAQHHIFSAIAMNLADEVRSIVSRDAGALNARMSRNENNQLPLQFAVRMKRPAMIDLLLELGADPLGVDGAGQSVAVYAESPSIDREVMKAIHAMTVAELMSAERGQRAVRAGVLDLVAAVSLEDWDTAVQLLDGDATLIDGGVLHIMAKRGDKAAVQWLLEQGANPSGLWSHWEAEVTPMHLAAWQGHDAVVQHLLDAGADGTIHDSLHDSTPLGWAEYSGQNEVVRILGGVQRR